MKPRSEYPVFKLLEEKSEFFCPAKWTELYLYLNHGNSNSCHHPIPHKIPVELLDNPTVLHNTPHKLKMQQLMMEGHRPQECHMCWHIEDLDEHAVSDRIHKSQVWANDISSLAVDPEYVPKFIEVIFDNTCNLMCSYCDSGQSTTWENKIKSEKLLLKTDYRKLYHKLSIDPTFDSEPYVSAWMEWWPKIQDKVDILRISGGEPLISKNCWKFMESIDSAKHLKLSFNSNLTYNTTVLQRLTEISHKFKEVHISASLDAVGSIAEYARQNLSYDRFIENFYYWCENSPDNCTINLQSTVNVFNIWGLTDLFDLSISLKKRYPTKVSDVYNTIVRFPEFQSVNVLPDNLKIEQANLIDNWLDNNVQFLSAQEQDYINKIVIYLKNNPEPLKNLPMKNLLWDLKKFIEYYDRSSTRKFNQIYPSNFVTWVNNIN